MGIPYPHDEIREDHFKKINKTRKRWKNYKDYLLEMTNLLHAKHPQYNQTRQEVYNGMVKHYSIARHGYTATELEKVIQNIVKDHFLEKEHALTRLILESE